MENVRDTDRIYTWLKHGCYQRTLHYHNTPAINAGLYEAQLGYIDKNYDTVTPEDVLAYLKTGIRKERPSILIGAFDGYRNNYDVLYRRMKERKMHGWYLLVADFLDTAPEKQERALTPYRMQWVPYEYEDGRYAMSWAEASEIGREHTIVNHTSTHWELTENDDDRTLGYEISHSHELISKNLGKEPKIMSWLGGAGISRNVRAEKMLRQYGYHFQIGYCLEYFDENDAPDTRWEMAQPDGTALSSLDDEIRRYEQIISNIGWYSAVPSILPLYQKGYFITDGNNEEDRKLAKHYAALADCLVRTRGMAETAAAWRALEVLAVSELGEGFPFH